MKQLLGRMGHLPFGKPSLQFVSRGDRKSRRKGENQQPIGIRTMLKPASAIV